MARRALVVASYQYADSGLRQLVAPAHDAEAFAAVLEDPQIAGFDVTTLVNQPHYAVGEAIADFYARGRGEDLTVVYFTGHGLKDDEGRLYLAMTNTRREALLWTAISAAQLNEAMESSPSRRKVLILDCCYSGAFPAGTLAKADDGVGTLERFHGKGRAVLTASDATQYAFEGDDVRGSGTSSVFTRHLVEALRSGEADLDKDGDIALDELYSYVYDRVVAEMPQQRPKRQEDVDGRIFLARNVHWTLPPYLQSVMESPIAAQKLGAVDGLAHLHRVGNDFVRSTVARYLTQLADDDSRAVSAAASAVLQRVEGGAAPADTAAARSLSALSSANDELAWSEQAQAEPQRRAVGRTEPPLRAVPGGTVAKATRGEVDEYADLEIRLHRRDALTWSVELTFTLPRTDAGTLLDVSGPLLAHIDPRELGAIDDEEEYGLALGEGLFGGGVGAAFHTALATSQTHGVGLRVRLTLGIGASALHGLRWETLRDPLDRSALLTRGGLLFSRYVSSQDWRPSGGRLRADLSALAVVAGPLDLGAIDAGRPMAPVRVDEELARAREVLASLPLTTLPGNAAPTEANMLARLRHGYEVLYIVCHGYVVNDEPVLLLVDEGGRAAPLLASELIDQLRDLPRQPRLVFLAPCQSAGAGADRRSEDAGVLAALGPRLAEVGIPAVVAMQGDISMITAATFAGAFFSSLETDGLVDRATAFARGAVRDRPDWWVPTLFTRVASGRLWFLPGIGSGGEPFEKWPALVSEFKDAKCTPIIGPGISDALLGTRQEIAMDWARSYRFPMAPYNRESLTQVAQYLSINQGRLFPRVELKSYLRRTLVERYRDDLPEDLLDESASFEDLIAGAWRARHEREEVEPYSVLAQLPAPVYVTTQPFRLLARALRNAGREPEEELCHWHEDAEWPESVFEREPGYRPTVERPLIYHLFGTFDQPESLVLTEDDYFDFFIGVTRNEDLLPSVVRRRLSDSALMFVGFRLDAFDFRVLYRSMMSSEGRRRSEYSHVAQMDPEEGITIDAERARRYLENYFSNAYVSLYWGGAEDFLRKLNEAWGVGK